MALSAQYITVRLQQHSSGTTNAVIAESTSVDAQFGAEALEATSQTNGLTAVFEAGKNKITVSGDYLTAADGATFDALFVHANAGDKFEVMIYRSSTPVLDTEGVFTSLNQSGALSDSLATGAYSIECDSSALEDGYGVELNTTSNAISDPNGTEANTTTPWIGVNLNGIGSNVFESQSSVKNVGSYAFHADCSDTPTSLARFYLSLPMLAPYSIIDGNHIKITFDIRHTGTGTPPSGQWKAYLASSNNGTDHELIALLYTETTWQTVEIEFTYDSTYRDLIFTEASSNNDGGIYLDNLSVKKKI